MSAEIFKDIARKISNLPDRGILEALDIECKTFRRDLGNCRLDLPSEVYSVLYFRLFVRAAKVGDSINCIVPLPADHIKFYRETLVRLVQANELPPSAISHFESTFAIE